MKFFFTLSGLIGISLGVWAGPLDDNVLQELQALLSSPPTGEELSVFDLPPGHAGNFQGAAVERGTFYWSDPLVEREKFTFRSPAGDLATGFLFKPAGVATPVPGVLVLSGSPGKSITKSLFARDLAKAGMIAVIFDALPSRKSTHSVTFETDQEDFKNQVRDLRLVLSWMRSRKDIRSDQLGVVGESLGGCIGATLTGLEPSLKAFLFQIALPGFLAPMAFGQPVTGYSKVFQSLNSQDTATVLRQYYSFDPVRLTLLPRSARVLWQMGTQDTIFPKKTAEKILGILGGPQEVLWYPTGHNVTQEMDKVGVAWLGEQLRSEKP